MTSQTLQVQVHRRVRDDSRAAGRPLVDIHCHCLPGVDDGPATMPEAVALCAKCADRGAHTVIATPHQLGRYDGVLTATQIRQKVAHLRGVLALEGVPLRVLPGADVRLDERLPELLERDEVMTLADGRKYLLLELPHQIFVDPMPLIEQLKQRSMTVILSHPERHLELMKRGECLVRIVSSGALLQVTAGSLLGEFGSEAEAAAWTLLESGRATLVASDAHGAARRGPTLAGALDVIGERMGLEFAWEVCVENPSRIVAGAPVVRGDGALARRAGARLVTVGR